MAISLSAAIEMILCACYCIIDLMRVLSLHHQRTHKETEMSSNVLFSGIIIDGKTVFARLSITHTYPDNTVATHQSIAAIGQIKPNQIAFSVPKYLEQFDDETVADTWSKTEKSSDLMNRPISIKRQTEHKPDYKAMRKMNNSTFRTIHGL